jgi:predicted RNA binding protein YcfA (HicA-like mRNA interferase family)
VANVEKLIEKMRNQPAGIRFEEADHVLASKGFRMDHQRGSHCQYIADDRARFTLPCKSPLKKIYAELILDLIKDR